MIHIVSGPPCSGKSTYVREHAAEGDIVVDYGMLAEALGDSHWDVQHHDLVQAVRRAAIDWCLPRSEDVEAWVIDTRPSRTSSAAYDDAGAERILLDVPRSECERRAYEDSRPQQTLDAISSYFEHEKGYHTMQKKSFDLVYEANEVAEGGEIVAYASTFDRIPDSYGDIVAPGAFAKSLAEWEASGNPIPLLFGHRTDDPRMNIGAVVEAEEDDRGLRIRAKFDPENDVAQYSRKLVMEGRLSKLSFAYDTLDSAPVVLEDGTRANELRELKIYEISLVPIPANELTEVISAKSGDTDPTDDVDEPVDEQDVPADEPVDEDVTPVEEKAAKADDPVSDALSTIAALADRLDGIADMIDDMVKRIEAATLPVDAAKDGDISIKGEDDAANAADNAEAPHEGNAEVEAKAAEILARMSRYISTHERN